MRALGCFGQDDGRSSSTFARPLRATEGKKAYFLILLGFSLLAFLSVALVFFLKGRSLVWSIDGVKIYYNFFVYTGEWLRQIASSLVAGQFVVPQFSFDLGFGYDIPVAVVNYLYDPLNWISAFCPREYAEYLFELVMFAHFYLAAVTFSLYCFSRGKSKPAALLGAMCYVLCGFVVCLGLLKHPYFIAVAAVFPLVLMGADKLFAGKSPVLLVCAMGFMFAFSMYWSYMMCLLLFFYCLIMYFAYPRKREPLDFLLTVLKFAGALVFAFLLVGFASIPNLLGLLSLSRLSVENAVQFFHSAGYYQVVGLDMVWGLSSLEALHLGPVAVMGIVAFLAAGSLVPRGDRAMLTSALVLCLFGVLVNYVGSVFNGFGYATDRWLFALGFFGAFATMESLPLLGQFDKRRRRLLVALVVLLTGLIAFGVLRDNALIGKLALVVWVIVAAVLFFLPSLARLLGGGRLARGKSVALTLASLMVVCSNGLLASVANSHWGADRIGSYIPIGQVADYSNDVPLADTLGGLDLDYRIDRGQTPRVSRNLSFSMGFKGMEAFSSMYNSSLDAFRQEMGLADNSTNFTFFGVDQRFALEGLLGGRYYVARTDAEMPPFGYHRLTDLGSNRFGESYTLYEADYVLPLAFTYEASMPFSEYEKLNMVEKQEAMTQAVILSGVENDAVHPVIETKTSAPDVVSADGLQVFGDKVLVHERNATLVLGVDGADKSENYVCFEGLTYRWLNKADREVAQGALEGGCEVPEGLLEGSTSVVQTKVYVSDGDVTEGFDVFCPGYVQYGGKKDWAVNMGYSEESVDRFTVTFLYPGLYSFDELYVAAQQMTPIAEDLHKLIDQNAARVEFGDNSMDVSVEAAQSGGEDERFLFLSIPIADGWSATMDNEPVTIQEANGGFMAVAMNGAPHELRFAYETPGLRIGAVSTLVCLAVAALRCAARAARRRNAMVRL